MRPVIPTQGTPGGHNAIAHPVKHGFIPTIFGTREAWEAMEQGLFIALDFTKAFDSGHHNYFKAHFLKISLSVPMTAVLMSMLTPPFIFRGGRGGAHVLRFTTK